MAVTRHTVKLRRIWRQWARTTGCCGKIIWITKALVGLQTWCAAPMGGAFAKRDHMETAIKASLAPFGSHARARANAG